MSNMLWMELLVEIWDVFGLLLTEEQAKDVFSEAFLSELETMGLSHPEVHRKMVDEMSVYVVECPYPLETEVQEDPEYLDYFMQGLLHMAEVKGFQCAV